MGHWRNAGIHSPGLTRIVIEDRKAGATARAFGAPVSDGDPAIDWGRTDLHIFACLDEAGHPSLTALARWDLDSLEVHLQLRVPAGTLAIAGFNNFLDDRMNYATREFFYRISE